jgi:hypothetical protein
VALEQHHRLEGNAGRELSRHAIEAVVTYFAPYGFVRPRLSLFHGREAIMKVQRCFTVGCAMFLLALGLLPVSAAAQSKKTNKYACKEANPASQCNASNTCGSASTPCTVDVRRTSYSATATPSTPGAKGSPLFCVQAGTAVTWQSSAKNTGFLVDFGPALPFDPSDPIMGGSKKSVEVKAAKPGCYLFDFQATDSSGIYGMSKASQSEMIILGAK